MLAIFGYVALLILSGVWLYFIVPSVVRMSRRSTAVQRHAKEILQNRRSLSAKEFGQECFPHKQSAAATRLRQILEKILIVDVSRITAKTLDLAAPRSRAVSHSVDLMRTDFRLANDFEARMVEKQGFPTFLAAHNPS